LKRYAFLDNSKRFLDKFILILTLVSIILVIILDANFLMGFLDEKLFSLNYKLLLFSIYVTVFILSSLFLLKKSYNIMLKKQINFKFKKSFIIIIFIIFFILSGILIDTTIQMLFSKSYNSLVFYITSYVSFISTFGFLSILCFQFFYWYLKGKNIFILVYGILFSFYCITLIFALIYLISGLAIHPSTINHTSPSLLRANTFSININFQNTLANIYDTIFLISFILAWILTVLMLKQYTLRIGKYKFWILVGMPLFFSLIRYEGILFTYVNYYEFITLPVIGNIYKSVQSALLIAFANSSIQTSGLFFGFSFLPILLKLNNYPLKNYMKLTLIGMILLFISRDFDAIFLNSVPPGGVVTISFMPIGAYLLFTGIISFLQIATRDKQFYKDLTIHIENDSELLKNIILSEKEKEISKKIKPLISYSIKWQKEQGYEAMKTDEINQIINDVISEFHKGDKGDLYKSKKN
jgi:hypothetical protein